MQRNEHGSARAAALRCAQRSLLSRAQTHRAKCWQGSHARGTTLHSGNFRYSPVPHSYFSPQKTGEKKEYGILSNGFRVMLW